MADAGPEAAAAHPVDAGAVTTPSPPDDQDLIPYLTSGASGSLGLWDLEFGLAGGVATGSWAIGAGVSVRLSVIDALVHLADADLPVRFGDLIGLDCFPGYQNGGGNYNSDGFPFYLRAGMDVGAQVLGKVSRNVDLGVEAAYHVGGSTLPAADSFPVWGGLRFRYGWLGLSAAGGEFKDSSNRPGIYWRGGARALAGSGDYFELRMENYGATCSTCPSATEAVLVYGLTWWQ
jgi:hypothetical protein